MSGRHGGVAPRLKYNDYGLRYQLSVPLVKRFSKMLTHAISLLGRGRARGRTVGLMQVVPAVHSLTAPLTQRATFADTHRLGFLSATDETATLARSPINIARETRFLQSQSPQRRPSRPSLRRVRGA
jgi:hypothetical protein